MSAKIISNIQKELNDETKPWTQWIALLEAKTNIPRLYLFGIGLVIFALYLICGYGAQLICNTIGFGYPAYKSLKAIETPHKGDDTKWLTYWTVFAAFSLVEFFSDIIVGWVPVYWLVKCAFLIWLFAPLEENGSVILYNRVLRPYFLKYEGRVDSTLHDLKDHATKLVANKLLEEKKD